MVYEYSKLCELLVEKGWLRDPSLQDALRAVAQAYTEEDLRQCAMGELGLALLSVGALEPAREALSKISLKLEKATYLGRAAQIAFKQRNLDLADVLIEEAKIAADQIPGIPERAEGLMEIGRVLGVNDRGRAKALLLKAASMFAGASDPYDRAEGNGILWSISRALNELGFSSEALNVANAIQADANRNAAIAEIRGTR